MVKEKNKYASGIVIALFSEVLFGLSFIFIKLVVDDVSVFTLLSWRSIFAFFVMTICVLLGILKIDLKGKNLKPLLMLSFFQPVAYFIMETMGIRLTTASESGTILACIPIITMSFSAIFLKDKPSKRQVFFMILTVTGAVIIGTVNGFTASSNLLGYFFLLIAMCCEGAYSVTSQSLKDFNSAEKTYAMVASGAVVFTLIALVENGINGTISQYLTLPFTDMNFLICIAYLGIGCSVVAFFCANYSISIIGATRRASFAGLATVTAIIGGVFYLHEAFTLIQGFATVLILVGAYGVNKR
ncbi:drug/metabolite transporter (DMT)-like permease [Clostridiales Family XIII bacterium PM5-7]